MEVALDSVTVGRLLRAPRRTGRRSRDRTCLDAPITARLLRIAIDPDRAIVDEWERTAGPEYVHQLVIKWEGAGALFPVRELGRLGQRVSKKLLQLGFVGTIDKLLVKVAMVIRDRIVVSDDSDFWDPSKPHDRRIRGNQNAPVAKLLTDELNVNVYTLRMLVRTLPS